MTYVTATYACPQRLPQLEVFRLRLDVLFSKNKNKTISVPYHSTQL